MKLFRKAKKGFTLVELVVVIAVIAILAAVSVGAYFGVTESANNSRFEQESKQVHTAIQTVALAPNEHSNLSKQGLIVNDFINFDRKLEETLGKTVTVTTNVAGIVDNEPTILLSTQSFSKTNEQDIYKTFEYYIPEIPGKKSITDIISGEVKVTNSSVEVPDNPDEPEAPIAPEPTLVATSIELSRTNINYELKGYREEPFEITAKIKDQFGGEMTSLIGEWSCSDNNCSAYSYYENTLTVTPQAVGTVSFTYSYLDLSASVTFTFTDNEVNYIKYNLVNSEQSNWEGTYMIGSFVESDLILFDSNLDELDNDDNAVEVSYSYKSNSIKIDNDVHFFKIERIEGTNSYSIKANNGKYIGNHTNENDLVEDENILINNIKFNYNDGSIDISSDSGSHLRYNPTLNRFRYFSDSTYDQQNPIFLYKLDSEEMRDMSLLNIELNSYNLYFNSLDYQQIEVKALYSNNVEKDVTNDCIYTPEDESIVSVIKGRVKPLKAGSTTIRVEYGRIYDDISVTIEEFEISEKFVLITDNSQLNENDQVIITAKNYDFAMSTTQNNNNRGAAVISKNQNELGTPSDKVAVFTLEEGLKENTFSFNTGNGYLYAASNSDKNYLKTQTTLDENGSWSIAVSADGTATIIAQGKNLKNTMQYNDSSEIFSCYGSASQKALSIYKLVSNIDIDEEEPVTPEIISINAASPELNFTKCGSEELYVKALYSDNNEKILESSEFDWEVDSNYIDFDNNQLIVKDGVENGEYTISFMLKTNSSITTSTKIVINLEENITTNPNPETQSLTFDNVSKRTQYEKTSIQVWEENGIVLTNNKAASTNEIGNYSNPARFYQGSEIILQAPGEITKIVFDCNSSTYATALKTSIGTVSGATVTVSSDKVTVVFSPSVEKFTIAKLSAQVRMDSLDVTYIPN